MSYQLDTNVVVDALRQGSGPVQRRLRAAMSDGVAISSIVRFELWYGVVRSGNQDRHAELLRAFLAGPVDVLHFGVDEADCAAEIRADLASDGRLIGPYDIMIAAQALRADATLVTANTREFHRVKGLRCENWR
ncbi:MAG: type II toxin-antitoxin system VapC family toxin [Alphaproteobacteria bacterium]